MHSRAQRTLVSVFYLSMAVVASPVVRADEPGPPGAAAVDGTAVVAAPDGGVASSPDAAPAESTAATPSAGGGLFEQSAAAAAASPMAPAAGGMTLGGYVRGDVYAGKIPGSHEPDLKTGYGEVALTVRTAKSAYGDGFAETRMRYGRQGDLQQTFLDVREAYVNAYLGPVDLRLGKQIIVWGRADLLNPTNNLTPNDLRIRSPIDDDRRIGNLAARGFLRLAPLPMRIEGVWVPFYVPSELPQVYLPQFVTFGDPTYPEPMLRNGLGAGKIHLELPGFEGSVSYLQGPAPLPGLTLGSLTFDPENPQVLISRTAYRQQVVGFDFSTAIGDLVAIRGEAAYRRPFNYKDRIYNPRPDLQYALGLDHTFGSVSVIVQYLGRYAFDWHKALGPATDINPDVLRMDKATGEIYRETYTDTINLQLAKMSQILFTQTERVQHLATMRLEWLTLHDTLSLSAIGMVNVSTKEWLAAPKLGYRMSDSLTAYVGAEVLTGPAGTLFGLVDQTLSAGYAELRSTF
jgi:hypothetical protein